MRRVTLDFDYRLAVSHTWILGVKCNLCLLSVDSPVAVAVVVKLARSPNTGVFDAQKVVELRWLAEPGESVPKQGLIAGIIEGLPCHQD